MALILWLDIHSVGLVGSVCILEGFASGCSYVFAYWLLHCGKSMEFFSPKDFPKETMETSKMAEGTLFYRTGSLNPIHWKWERRSLEDKQNRVPCHFDIITLKNSYSSPDKDGGP